jgi:uncharacterized protein YjbI with pentapeptide repeats
MDDRTRAQIARINELSHAARGSWVTLLAFLGFTGVTLLGVQDADFFVPSRETVLPLVAVRIPTASFFWVAPVLGAALYVYLHLHLEKLWDALAVAPARVDGAPLGNYLHSWFGLDLALAMKGGGALQPGPMAWLVHLVTRALVWIAGPLVLTGFWWRSMPAHDERLTLTIAAGVVATLYAGITSWWHAVTRLRRPWAAGWESWLAHLAALAGILVLGGASWLAARHDLTIDRDTPWVGRFMGTRSVSTLVPARLSEIELVQLPDDWRRPEAARLSFREHWCDEEGLPGDVCDRPPDADRPVPPQVVALRKDWCAENLHVTDCPGYFREIDARFMADWAEERENARWNLGRLNLAGRDLRRVAAASSTLVGAVLTGSRLEGADLRWAWMEGVDLAQARLDGANLLGAELQQAVLTGASLTGADLRETELEDAFMPDAQLQGAHLGEARLDRAYLLNADLAGASLNAARLDAADLSVAGLEGADLRTARLTGADLRGARLQGADLRWADLRSVRWAGAQTGAGLAHYADLRGADDLSQAQLAGLVGNAGTLLPDHPAPDTRAGYYVLSCWPEPPPGFDALVGRLARGGQPAADIRAGLLCPPGGRPRRTGTACAADIAREACVAVAQTGRTPR